jgi:coenzyme Q-binding protein COQ10
MPKLFKTITAAYSQHQLFDLVADVAAYPQFLPFCTKTDIHETSDTHMIADMHIGYKNFTGAFQSKVTKEFPRILRMEQTHGSLKYLHSNWSFQPHATSTLSTIEFTIDFEPSSWLVGKLITPVLDEIGTLMIQSFLNRAKVIYGI